MGRKIIVLLTIFICINISVAEDISKEAHCAGCQATVKALVLRMMHQSKVAAKKDISWRMREAIKGICKAENFDSHEFRTEKLVASCKQFLAKHKPALEKVVKKDFKTNQAPPAAGIANEFCFETTGLCKGLEEKYIREHAQKKPESFDTEELLKLHADKVRKVIPRTEEL